MQKGGTMTVVNWTRNEMSYFENAKNICGESLAYEQNWLYLIQAMRRGGWVYRDTNGWIAVSKDYLGIGRHAAVVPISNNLVTFLDNAMEALHTKNIKPEIIKHVPEYWIKSILSCGGSIVQQHSNIMKEVYFEDFSEDRFPQVLVDVGSQNWINEESDCNKWIPITLKGSKLQDFRYQVRRFCRRYFNEGISVNNELLSNCKMEDVELAINNWLESVKKRFKQPCRPKIHDYGACFSKPIQEVARFVHQNPTVGEGSLITVGDVPSAMWIGSHISEDCFGIYVLFADTSIRGLSEYTMYLALLRAKELGVRYVNMGGSELESLFMFKNKATSRTLENSIQTRRIIDIKWNSNYVLSS